MVSPVLLGHLEHIQLFPGIPILVCHRKALWSFFIKVDYIGGVIEATVKTDYWFHVVSGRLECGDHGVVGRETNTLDVVSAVRGVDTFVSTHVHDF